MSNGRQTNWFVLEVQRELKRRGIEIGDHCPDEEFWGAVSAMKEKHSVVGVEFVDGKARPKVDRSDTEYSAGGAHKTGDKEDE